MKIFENTRIDASDPHAEAFGIGMVTSWLLLLGFCIPGALFGEPVPTTLGLFLLLPTLYLTYRFTLAPRLTTNERTIVQTAHLIEKNTRHLLKQARNTSDVLELVEAPSILAQHAKAITHAAQAISRDVHKNLDTSERIQRRREELNVNLAAMSDAYQAIVVLVDEHQQQAIDQAETSLAEADANDAKETTLIFTRRLKEQTEYVKEVREQLK